MNLIGLDYQIFRWINLSYHNSLLDSLAGILHSWGAAGTMYVLIFIGVFFWNRKYRLLLEGLLALALTHIVADLVLKNLFHRLRPDHVLTEIYLIQPVPGGFSLPSGEAATAAAFAAVIFLFYPNKLPAYFAIALAIFAGIARIYMGHHFPSDVLAGWIVGGMIALIVDTIFKKYEKKRFTW